MKVIVLLAASALVTPVLELPSGHGPQHQPQAIASGLILLAMANTSFFSTFSTVSAASLRGTLAAPASSISLTAPERVAAFALDGTGHGLMAGMGMMLALSLMVPIGIAHAPYFAAYALTTCLMLALLGILCGASALSARRFTALDGAILVSLAFLLAVVVPIAEASLAWRAVAQISPAHHLIDGFRYGVTGQAQSSPAAGLMIMGGLAAILTLRCCRALAAVQSSLLR